MDDQNKAREFIVEYTSIFAMWDVNLCEISLVRHSVRLMDNTPFMDHYQQFYSVCVRRCKNTQNRC